MAPRPFRFGVQVRNAPDAKAWRDLARKAEDSGYSTLFVPDHFGEGWSPTVPLTVAAEATTMLKVGALVHDNDFRHPLILARDAAALDFLSGGRVEVGLGAGWMTSDYGQSGIAFDPPGVRVERLAEALEVIRLLWTQPSVTFAGTHYTLNDAQCFPAPTTPGGPPLIVGGGGRRVLTLAARHASIIGVNPDLRSGLGGLESARTGVIERYRERIGWIREAAGDRFDAIELQILSQVEKVTTDRAGYAAALAPKFGYRPSQTLAMPVVLVGTVDQICADLVQRREELGLSYVVLHRLDDFVPVVARLAGT